MALMLGILAWLPSLWVLGTHLGLFGPGGIGAASGVAFVAALAWGAAFAAIGSFLCWRRGRIQTPRGPLSLLAAALNYGFPLCLIVIYAFMSRLAGTSHGP